MTRTTSPAPPIHPAARRSASAVPRRSRLEALDLVRLVAIVGMMTAHLLVPVSMSPGHSWQAPLARAASILTEGTSATLFAVVGGCSMVLAARQRLLAGDRRAAVISGVLRGALVTAIGLLLGFVPTYVIVVLVPFGLGMMITAPLLLVPSRVLIPIASVLALGGGWLNATVRQSLRVVQEIGNVTPLDVAHPLVLVRGLLLTGMYPLITWLPYLLLGVVLMRSLLRAIDGGSVRRWSVTALSAGGAAAVLAYGASALVKAWARGHVPMPELVSLHGFGAPLQPTAWALMVANPHTGTITDMIATAGVSVALIGLLTLVVPSERHLRATAGRSLRAAGAAPLTLYTIHVVLTGVSMLTAVLLAGGDDALQEMPWYVGGLGVLGVHLLLVVVIGAVLAARRSRGPLEALLSRVVGRVAGPRAAS